MNSTPDIAATSKKSIAENKTSQLLALIRGQFHFGERYPCT